MPHYILDGVRKGHYQSKVKEFDSATTAWQAEQKKIYYPDKIAKPENIEKVG